MDLDDLVPKKKSYELGQDLSKLSVGELAELIEGLKEEIARVQRALLEILAQRRGRGLQAC